MGNNKFIIKTNISIFIFRNFLVNGDTKAVTESTLINMTVQNKVDELILLINLKSTSYSIPVSIFH